MGLKLEIIGPRDEIDGLNEETDELRDVIGGLKNWELQT